VTLTPCAGASADDIAHLQTRLARCEHGGGTLIVRRAELADALYLLMRGEVSMTVDLPQGVATSGGPPCRAAGPLAMRR
jgi:hypothetical protein